MRKPYAPVRFLRDSVIAGNFKKLKNKMLGGDGSWRLITFQETGSISQITEILFILSILTVFSDWLWLLFLK